MSERYHLGDQLEVKIEKIVTNGLGMGFGEQLTVFVPFAATGDLLAVEIGELRGRTAFASILKILEPGEGRQEPICEHYLTCGGCDFQHLEYEKQLEAKSGIIDDCLKRIGHIDIDSVEVLPSPEQSGYRLRTKFHHDPETKATGFFRRLSHEVVDIEHCPVLTEEMNSALGNVREVLKDFDASEELIDVDAAAAGEGKSVYSTHLIEPVEELSVRVNGEEYFFNASSFFQANIHTLGKLIELATNDLSGDLVFDLYSGAGLFSLPLSRSFKNVVAVEAEGRAIASAKRTAELARSSNIRFEKLKIREFLDENNEGPDTILVDPPRGGIKRKVLERLIGLGAQTFVYVSCNPSTLARDLAVLIEYGYSLDSIIGLDMFPQTSHVETVVRLSRSN